LYSSYSNNVMMGTENCKPWYTRAIVLFIVWKL